MEVWAEDEARFGLKPTVRRLWTRKGIRPLAWGHKRYKWSYLYGFVRPQTGRLFTLILPTVNLVVMERALALFAQAVGAGPTKWVVLVLDGAGWHKPRKLAIPDGIHLLFLPAYSPELQPAERLWPLINEAIANRCFDTIEALEDVVAQRCVQLESQGDYIRGLTHYSWWQDQAE